MIIDVRTKDEYEEGHAEGAVNIPLGDIMAGDLGVLAGVAKREPLQLYCRSGARSAAAQGLLTRAGFTSVENLGGLTDALRALGS